MKSKLTHFADYREIPLEKEVVIRCSDDYLKKKVNYVARKFKTRKGADVVAKGDVVYLDVESALPRYNRKNVPVTIGGNLYHEGLEQAVEGHRAGETFHTCVEDEDVKVTILSASRTVYPTVTDEMAASAALDLEGMEGVTTVAEYRRRTAELYFKEQRQEYIFDKMDEMFEHMRNGSEMDADEAEVDALYDQLVCDAQEAAFPAP